MWKARCAGGEVFQCHYALVARDKAGYGPAEHVVNLGTGPGHLLVALRQHFPKALLVGIDVSPAMVAQARRNVKACGQEDRIKVRVADANALPLSDGTFDRLVSTDSLHHWKDPLRAISEVQRVLKVGGCAPIYDLVRDMPAAIFKEFRAQCGGAFVGHFCGCALLKNCLLTPKRWTHWEGSQRSRSKGPAWSERSIVWC